MKEKDYVTEAECSKVTQHKKKQKLFLFSQTDWINLNFVFKIKILFL